MFSISYLNEFENYWNNLYLTFAERCFHLLCIPFALAMKEGTAPTDDFHPLEMYLTKLQQHHAEQQHFALFRSVDSAVRNAIAHGQWRYHDQKHIDVEFRSFGTESRCRCLEDYIAEIDQLANACHSVVQIVLEAAIEAGDFRPVESAGFGQMVLKALLSDEASVVRCVDIEQHGSAQLEVFIETVQEADTVDELGIAFEALSWLNVFGHDRYGTVVFQFPHEDDTLSSQFIAHPEELDGAENAPVEQIFWDLFPPSHQFCRADSVDAESIVQQLVRRTDESRKGRDLSRGAKRTAGAPPRERIHVFESGDRITNTRLEIVLGNADDAAAADALRSILEDIQSSEVKSLCKSVSDSGSRNKPHRLRIRLHASPERPRRLKDRSIWDPRVIAVGEFCEVPDQPGLVRFDQLRSLVPQDDSSLAHRSETSRTLLMPMSVPDGCSHRGDWTIASVLLSTYNTTFEDDALGVRWFANACHEHPDLIATELVTPRAVSENKSQWRSFASEFFGRPAFKFRDTEQHLLLDVGPPNPEDSLDFHPRRVRLKAGGDTGVEVEFGNRDRDWIAFHTDLAQKVLDR